MNSLFIRAAKRWWNAEPATHGAALAYYSIFSLAPIFIIFVVSFGRFFGQDIVQGRLLGALQSFVGTDASHVVEALVSYSYRPVESTVATIVSIVVLIIGSLALFSQAERALATIWQERKGTTVPYTFWQTKILAILMIAVLGGLIILSFVASAFTSLIVSHLSQSIVDISATVTNVSTYASVIYIIVLFAIMYKYLPGKPVSWKAALIGSIAGSVLFLIGRYLLGLYITSHTIASVYGAAGAVVLVLVWFYYSAQIFFFGGAVAYGVDQSPNLGQTLT
jgi:membrane protein